MTNVWVRPFDHRSPSEWHLFVEWLHANRARNRYDPRLFERAPDGSLVWCRILTFFNDKEIIGFMPMTLAFLAESMAFKPGLDASTEARALQAMQTWLVHRAFQERVPDAFFVTTDESVIAFAKRYGWDEPSVPCLNLHFQDLLPAQTAQEGGRIMGGPSKEAKANEAAQTAFYQQTTQQQSAAFAEQQGILQDIQSIVQPIVNAGPNQYGFTPEEDALLQSNITDTGAQATANAENAAQLQEKQAAGGTAILPTGAEEQINANLGLVGQQKTAQALQAEKLAGWEAGQQRYQSALNAFTGNASLINPVSYTSAATGAGSNATGAVNLADSERSNLLSSILGGVIGAGSSFLSGGLSNITGGGGFLSPAS